MIYKTLKKIEIIKKYRIFLKIYNLLYKFLIFFISKERVVNFYDVKVYINLSDYLVSRRLFISGSFNKPIENFILQNIKSEMTVVDVGSNIGIYTLLMSKLVGKDGKVFSFEPDNRNTKLLNKSIILNNFKNINLFNCLLSNVNSDNNKFYLDKDYFGSNSIIKNQLPSKLYKAINVKSLTLDSVFLNNQKKLDFIKVNVDGSELDFIEGAKETIKIFKPLIIIEYCVPRLQELDKFDNDNFLNFFRNLNYNIFLINNNNKKKFSNQDIKTISEEYHFRKKGTLHLVIQKND